MGSWATFSIMITSWEKASEFLLRNIDRSGGVPAVLPNDPIGCWTTAEVLDFLLDEHHLGILAIKKIRALATFLIENQDDDGGWPLTLGGEHTSTMSTGHALRALHKARTKEGLVAQTKQIANSITRAENWITSHQNADGGWGVEPDLPEGSASRIISTYYAVHGLSATKNAANNRCLSRANAYLLQTQNSDGGWGFSYGEVSDVGNTARAVLSLERTSESSPSDQSGLDFIKSHRDQWRMDVESYVAKASAGHVVFHSNTIVDVGNALMSSNFNDCFDVVTDIYQHISAQQTSDGSWHLHDWERTDRSVVMWCTSEYARFLANYAYKLSIEISQNPDFFSKCIERHYVSQTAAISPRKRLFTISNLLIVLLSVALVQSYYDVFGVLLGSVSWAWQLLLSAPTTVSTWWGDQKGITQWFLATLGAIFLGLFINLITPYFQRTPKTERQTGQHDEDQ